MNTVGERKGANSSLGGQAGGKQKTEGQGHSVFERAAISFPRTYSWIRSPIHAPECSKLIPTPPKCSPERSSVWRQPLHFGGGCNYQLGSHAQGSEAAVDLKCCEPWHQEAGFKCSRAHHGGWPVAELTAHIMHIGTSLGEWPWPFTSTCYASFLPLWNGTNSNRKSNG